MCARSYACVFCDASELGFSARRRCAIWSWRGPWSAYKAASFSTHQLPRRHTHHLQNPCVVFGCPACCARPHAQTGPKANLGGSYPQFVTKQLNGGWPWPGRGLASCPQFGSFDGRSQGGFEKPALGCIFHRAGPGLPGDMRPGDDDKRNRPQGGFSKPTLGCIFHEAAPGLPRGR